MAAKGFQFSTRTRQNFWPEPAGSGAQFVCPLPKTVEDVQVVALVERALARRITPRRPVWQPGRVQDSVFQKQEAEELARLSADGEAVGQQAAGAVEGRAFIEPARRGQVRGGLELVAQASGR